MQTIVSQDVALFSGTVRSNLDPFNEHSDEECWNVLERCHLVSHSPSRTPAESGTHTPESEGGEPAKRERKTVVSSLLQPVSPSGSSLSAGERQLLALARAMLRNAKFTILDEASSAIDLETDDKVILAVFLPRRDRIAIFELETDHGERFILPCVDPKNHPRRDGRVVGHHYCSQVEDSDRYAHSPFLLASIKILTRFLHVDYDRILVLDMGTIAEYDTPEALLAKEGGLFREMCIQSADWEEIQAMVRRG